MRASRGVRGKAWRPQFIMMRDARIMMRQPQSHGHEVWRCLARAPCFVMHDAPLRAGGMRAAALRTKLALKYQVAGTLP